MLTYYVCDPEIQIFVPADGLVVTRLGFLRIFSGFFRFPTKTFRFLAHSNFHVILFLISSPIKKPSGCHPVLKLAPGLIMRHLGLKGRVNCFGPGSRRDIIMVFWQCRLMGNMKYFNSIILDATIFTNINVLKFPYGWFPVSPEMEFSTF